MSKIIGNTVGMGLPKPNLMQTDPTKGDYVKGKEEFLAQTGSGSSQKDDGTDFELDELESEIIDNEYAIAAEKTVSAEQARRLWAALDANATVLDSGVCGENLTWALYSTGLLKISGTGPAYDYCKGILIGKTREEIQAGIDAGTIPADYAFQEGKTYDDTHGQYVSPWYKYRSEDFATGYTTEESYNAKNPNGWKYDRIEIEPGITYIGDWMFYRVCGPVELTIPEGVTRIGRWGIRYSPDLLRVTLPESLTEIEYRGLSRMESLINIKVGNQITTIGDYGLAQNAKLPNIVLPDTLTSIGINLFEGTKGITRAKLGSVACIPSRTFVSNTALEYFEIPEEVTTIGEYAFYKTAIKKIRIPANVNRIDDLAFYACGGLDTVYIDSPVIASGMRKEYDFGRLYWYAHNIYIKKDLECAYAESNWEFVGVVGDYKKYYNSNPEVMEPEPPVEPEQPEEPENPDDAVVASGGYGNNASYVLTKTDVENEYALKLTGAGDVKTETPTPSYTPWISYKDSIVSVEIEGDITKMHASLFREYPNLRTAKLDIPKVEMSTFAKCSALANIELTERVNTIGGDAFWLTSLNEIVIPDSVTSIETQAFMEVSTPTKITIGKNVQTIGNTAFGHVSENAELVIPVENALQTIGDSNFKLLKCAEFGNLYLPNIVSIGNSVFRYATGFTSVVIGSNIQSIGTNAFSQLVNATVTIQRSESAVTIGDGAFGKLTAGNLVFTG